MPCAVGPGAAPPVRSVPVKLSPTAVMAHARSDEGRKQLRYAGVSLVFVPVGQILIQVLAATVFSGDENNFTWASITAAAILTLPNFFANKYVVWKETSKDNLRTQVLVFWVAAMLGVTFATLPHVLRGGPGAQQGVGAGGGAGRVHRPVGRVRHRLGRRAT